jgi:aminopeptidase N
LRFLEERLGSYPFRADKVGLVETPYLGMEHQTITAFGGKMENSAAGFVEIMFHELAHEWWGNLVTASDWRDFWLHEGFATYMEALYAEHLKGETAYQAYFINPRRLLNNIKPVASRESQIAGHVYNLPPDYTRFDGDIYYKGMLILHSLRYLIGDKAFFTALRRMAYPDAQMEAATDGKQCRFATTDDFLHIAEQASGMKLDWFFEVYLRQPKLPRLISEIKGNQLLLRWDTPDGLRFPMPVEVRLGSTVRRIEMPNGSAVVPLEAGQQPEIDPLKWILKAE